MNELVKSEKMSNRFEPVDRQLLLFCLRLQCVCVCVFFQN